MAKGHDNNGRDLWPRMAEQKYAREATPMTTPAPTLGEMLYIASYSRVKNAYFVAEYWDRMHQVSREGFQHTAEAFLAAVRGDAEPVAWRYKNAWGEWSYCHPIDNQVGPTVITEKQPLYTHPSPKAADRVEEIARIKQELFTLCEATEDECIAKLADEREPHIEGFYRGRKTEAKAISRAMSEVFREIAALLDGEK